MRLNQESLQTATLGVTLLIAVTATLQAVGGTVETNSDTQSDLATYTADNWQSVAIAGTSTSNDDSFGMSHAQTTKHAKPNGQMSVSADEETLLSMRARGVNDKTEPTMATTSSEGERSSHRDALLTREETEILWLARILYSESKRAHEQKLIAWVVRNRVETNFRGGDTYEEIALQDNQFSGLHSYDARYEHNISRQYASEGQAWKNALAIAKEVYHAPGSSRPFRQTTRHFYSPQAVTNHPNWIAGKRAVHTITDPHTRQVRFAFYDRVR